MLSIDLIGSGLLQVADLVSPESLKEKRAFKEMEQVFLQTLLKEMRKTVPEGGIFEKTNSTRIYEEMLDEVMALKMAQSGQLGIAAAIEAQYTGSEAAEPPDGPSQLFPLQILK